MPLRVAIVGAGWAGMAAAVATYQQGHTATVFEAARTLGGRARALTSTLPDGTPTLLDNGQHILIGAYTETLRLMDLVGVNTRTALLRQPLSMPFVDGSGLQTPAWAAQWPAPLDAVAAIATTRGWSWSERASLVRASLGWQWAGFSCAPNLTVAQLCKGLAPRVVQELIEPLCVSALNTPAHAASGTVFLRVLQDALFGIRGGSHLLLPHVDLSALFPHTAAQWLAERGVQVHTGHRVEQLRPASAQTGLASGAQWLLDDMPFDHVIWATGASESARALEDAAQSAPDGTAHQLLAWSATAQALHYEAIATVYALAPGARLPQPMLALRSNAAAPAQFVFDRGQLGGPQGLLAFVVSASAGTRESVQAAVLQQAAQELAPLGLSALQVVQTVVEKRATFACTPGLVRPPQAVALGLWASGDYVQGPYPATLEGAVRSGWAAGTGLPLAVPLANTP